MTGPARLNRELVAQAKVSARPTGWSWTWTAVRVQFMGSRNRAPTTDISGQFAIIRCFCSTVRETALVGGWRQTSERNS